MTTCCNDKTTGTDRLERTPGTLRNGRRPRRIIIIGGGSAAFAAASRAVELGADQVTIINTGLPTGGTCVNVGCVPSKTLIRAAESLYRARHNPFAGIQTRGHLAHFPAIIEEKRRLVDGLRQAKYLDVIRRLPQVRLIESRGRLIDDKTVQVGGEQLVADHILIATGATAAIPDIPGLADVSYLTNQSLFELESLPESLIVLGGRYVALECAQLFARLGSRVTILQRSDRILPTQAEDITNLLTTYLVGEGLEIVTGVTVEQVQRRGSNVLVTAKINGTPRDFTAARILVATGRAPNTRSMGLQEAGVQLDKRGFITVDPTLQTTRAGVWAAGDVLGQHMFVYTAAYEGALAAENALTGAGRAADYTALPWVIFTDPQVAGVGLDERQAREAGWEAESAALPLAHVPRAIAARDTRGVIQLIRDRKTDRLLGARILAAEGSELLMEAALAIKFGITVHQLRESFHPYLTLGEGMKLAALAFVKDPAHLSCCAT